VVGDRRWRIDLDRPVCLARDQDAAQRTWLDVLPRDLLPAPLGHRGLHAAREGAGLLISGVGS